MKRRHYLICSIIAMLSIVSYACETEYAICEGGGGTGGTSGDACRGNIQKCAENLNGKQVCKDDKWGNDAACNYCFNKNTDNSDATSLVCDGCTPNSYDKSGKKVCYKGAFKKFESKSDSNPNSGIVINSNLKSDDAPWEFAYNNSGPLKYYNCHNDNVLGSIKEGSGGGRIESCCEENDYYIKHIGYKYYSIEKCVKVEEEGILAGFMAYEYTDELNNSLIGQKPELLYGFCHKKNIFLAVNDNVVNDAKSVYHRYECGSGSECNSDYDGLCILDNVSIDVETTFMCDTGLSSMKDTAFVIKSGNDIIATCPAGTELKIDENGKWLEVDCTKQIFTLDKVRCAPIKSSNDRLTPFPKS